MAYYGEGVWQCKVVKQGFEMGQFGPQFVLTIAPQGAEKQFEQKLFMPFLDENGEPAKHIDKTIAALKFLGFVGEPSQLDPESKNHHSFVGQTIPCYCTHKADKEGKIWERWYVNTPKAAPTPVDNPMLRKLDALFGKALKGNGKPADKPKNETANQALNAGMTKEQIEKEIAGNQDIRFSVMWFIPFIAMLFA